MINKKIFIACDTNKISVAKKIIKHSNTKKLNIGYKFGLEFISSKNGRSFVSKIKDKIIFADLKLHDIPNTCASVVKAIKDLKVNYLTIHVSSGLEALKAAKKVSGKIKLIGVTTLTSINNYSLKQIGYDKKVFKKEIITPGIRFNSNRNDQKRVMTPKEAFKNGCDWLVIGRPITKGNIKKNIQTLIDHLNK